VLPPTGIATIMDSRAAPGSKEPMADEPAIHRVRLRIALLSIVVGCGVLALKYLAFHVSQSAALKSDAIENVVNVVAAVFALGAVVFADKPADREHPYGHGKIEHFSAAFEGGMISLAAVLVAYEAIRSMVEGIPLRNLSLGLSLNFFAGLVNGLLGLFLVQQGRRTGSRALEADGHHVFSDFYVTLGLAAGLLLVRATGLTWLDPAMALVVAGILAWTGFRLVQGSSAALLDAEDPALVGRLVYAINRVRPVDVVAVHELRTLRSGRYTHVDIHLVVPEFYEVGKAHDLADRFGAAVLEGAGVAEGELHTHVDPCQRAWCAQCDLPACPIRRVPKVNNDSITIDQAVAQGPI